MTFYPKGKDKTVRRGQQRKEQSQLAMTFYPQKKDKTVRRGEVREQRKGLKGEEERTDPTRKKERKKEKEKKNSFLIRIYPYNAFLFL